MLSKCCLRLTYSSEHGIHLGEETPELYHFSVEDRREVVSHQTAMDIALLEEQYNWIKKKQKLQTPVVLFRTASNDKRICGKSLVNVVPISQEVRNVKAFEEQMPVQEIQFNFVGELDSDKTLWRAHLGIHRMACLGNEVKVMNTSQTDIRNSTRNPLSITDYSTGVTEPFEVQAECICLEGLENVGGPQYLDSRSGSEQDVPTSRKFSAPADLSRSQGVRTQQSLTPSSNSYYYPFPQRKSIKKSEAARRLGMYSSF